MTTNYYVWLNRRMKAADKIEGNLLRGHLEMLVLAVLERGDAHGFEVMRRLDAAGRGALHLKEGTLYPILYRLKNAGCLTSQWDADTAKSQGPRRRIYRITKKGKRELAKRRAVWQSFVSTLTRIVET